MEQLSAAPFTIQWPFGSRQNQVFVAGFDDWNKRIPLERDPLTGKFEVEIKLAPGRYEYKFLIDGNDWKYNPDTRNDGKNNIIDFEDFLAHYRSQIEELTLANMLLQQRSTQLNPIHSKSNQPPTQSRMAMDPLSSEQSETVQFEPSSALQPRIFRLYKDGILTDLELEVENETYQVHRAILASASPVFQKMFEGSFSENGKFSVKLEVPNDYAFEDFIEYIYSGMILRVSAKRMISLLKLARMYQVEDLLRITGKYLADVLNVGDALDIIGERVHMSSVVIDRAMTIFAENFWILATRPELLDLPPELVTDLINHPKLEIGSHDQFTSIMLTYMMAGKDRAGFKKYLNTAVTNRFAQSWFASTIVCFFADGSQKYTEMTSHAVATFLEHTPRVAVGLLVNTLETGTAVLKSLPAKEAYRVIIQPISEKPHLPNWNPTQYKLDIRKFTEERGFQSVFWVDSDTITIHDISPFLKEFVTSPNHHVYLTPDHVMSDSQFKQRWERQLQQQLPLIPQACVMGFKSHVIDKLFSSWLEFWNRWISPEPFKQFQDPAPEFPGSSFCIEQYALGMAVNSTITPSAVKIFQRKLWPLKAASPVKPLENTTSQSLSARLPVGTGFQIYVSSQYIGSARVEAFYGSLMRHGTTSSLYMSSMPSSFAGYLGPNEFLVDYFFGIVHCYNHWYSEARQLIDELVVQTQKEMRK